MSGLRRIIWFDDALLDQYTIGFPLLKKYNINEGVVLGVITSRVGKTFQWTDPYIEFPTMNIDQIREMMAWGVTVASHSVSHPAFMGCTEQELHWQLAESKKWIQTNLGVIPEIFVTPYNYIYSQQLDIAKKYYKYIRCDWRYLDKKELNMNTIPFLDTELVIHNLKDDATGKMSNRWGPSVHELAGRFEATLKIEQLRRELIK